MNQFDNKATKKSSNKSPNYLNKKSKFAFIDETGLGSIDPTQPYLAAGALIINDTSSIINEMYKLNYAFTEHNLTLRRELINSLVENPKALNREELNSIFLTTRHHEFKFENINPNNLEKYIELIDILFNYDFRFVALLKDKIQIENTDSWSNYCDLIVELVGSCGPSKLIPVLDFAHKPADKQDIVKLLNVSKQVVNAMQSDSKSQILLQVTDLLLGSVLFEIKYKLGHFPNLTQKVKARKDFIKYLAYKFRSKKLATATSPKLFIKFD